MFVTDRLHAEAASLLQERHPGQCIGVSSKLVERNNPAKLFYEGDVDEPPSGFSIGDSGSWYLDEALN